MFEARFLKGSSFRFSQSDPELVHPDKMRGLLKWGPYRRLEREPRIGFVFPEGYRDQANNLFLALRNGIGYFKGLSTLFKVGFDRKQVFPITGFKLRNPHDHHEAAARYRDAITSWRQTHQEEADIFLNIHPKSLAWEEDSAYAACKAVLLEAGIISQNVTFELINNASQFEWAAANIALNIFVKLGGIPWVTNISTPTNYIVIGMGRAEDWDAVSRKRTRYTAFTTCFRENGIYELTNMGRTCHTRAEYLDELRLTVISSLKTSLERVPDLRGVVIHFPKDFSREEEGIVSAAVAELSIERPLLCQTLKVSEEERFFAFDDSQQGILPRGTCIRLGSNEYMLYTEGADEKASWSNRVPTAVRIRHFNAQDEGSTSDLISQIFDLSLVNFRGFKAKAFPISIYYSSLIAEILKRGARLDLGNETISSRMWFL
jgi:argonaute-like protein implicated in RNA metabolism and viral defense